MPRKVAVKKTSAVKAKKTVRKKTVKHQPGTVNVEIGVPVSPALISSTHGHSMYYSDMHFNTEHKSRHQKKQNLIIGLGVSIIMTAIVIAWILNLKKIIGPEVDAATQAQTPPYSDLSDLKKELTDTLSEVKGQLNELNTISAEPVTSTIAPETEEELRNAFKATVEKTITEQPTATTPPAVLP